MFEADIFRAGVYDLPVRRIRRAPADGTAWFSDLRHGSQDSKRLHWYAMTMA
jgi:hypothetical protein